MAWNFPEGIEKEQNISELDDSSLENYHDKMHIFWNKVEDGFIFDWTFREIFMKHLESVLEMMRRKIQHIHPINSLDQVYQFHNKKDFDHAIGEIKDDSK